jgi:hypothetical protein
LEQAPHAGDITVAVELEVERHPEGQDLEVFERRVRSGYVEEATRRGLVAGGQIIEVVLRHPVQQRQLNELGQERILEIDVLDPPQAVIGFDAADDNNPILGRSSIIFNMMIGKQLRIRRG